MGRIRLSAGIPNLSCSLQIIERQRTLAIEDFFFPIQTTDSRYKVFR